MSELDAFLGRPPITAAPAERDETMDPWLLMAKSDPSAWRKRGNPWTEKIAKMLADDAMLPLEGETGRDCRRLAARLLQEMGGPSRVEDAIDECRRREAKWRDLNLWVQAKLIVHAGARLRARTWWTEALDDDPIEDALIDCPRCGKRVYPERVEDDCRGH